MPSRSIPTFVRLCIVTLSQEGLSSREVSRRLRVNQSNVVWTWGDTGTVDDMHCSGRSKATTAVDGRYLWISAQRNADSNASMLNNALRAATGCRVLTQTVQNRLHDVQLHSRCPCHICLQPGNHQRRAWRQSGQAERLRHTVQRVQLGGGSLMVWGGIM